MYGHLYEHYIKIMSSGGSKPSASTPQNGESSVAHENVSFDESKTFNEVDTFATQLGNQYRGIGVAVGMLGAGIIFFAVTPSALQLHGKAESFIGVLEVILMLTMIGLVIYGTRTNLRQRWVTARRHAEMHRYRKFHLSIEKLRATLAPEDSRVVFSEINELLDGNSGQLTYNVKKLHQYERIEQLSDRAAWVGFVVGLAGALLHLTPIHASWLIYLTAFVPAVVGAIHGVNGFLQIGNLAEDHAVMADRLRDLTNRFASLDSESTKDILELSDALYHSLSSRDVQWVESTEKLGLRPA